LQAGQSTGPYVSQPNHVVAVREERFKLAKYYDPSADATKVASQWEMYDIVKDPLEKTNLAAPSYKRSSTQEANYLRLKKLLNKVIAERLAPRPLPRPVSIHIATKTVNNKGVVIEDQGTLTGAPFGTGKATLVYTLDPKTSSAATKFVFTSDIGLIRGVCSSKMVVSGNSISFNGTASFTSGTGAFRGIKATGLKFSEGNTLNGQNGAGSFTGTAYY
jgi:hypothetical protein